jgi:hypothetical protein
MSAYAGVVLQIEVCGRAGWDGYGGFRRDSHYSPHGLGDDFVRARDQWQEVGAADVAYGSANLLAGRVQRQDRRPGNGAYAGTLAGLFHWAGGPARTTPLTPVVSRGVTVGTGDGPAPE